MMGKLCSLVALISPFSCHLMRTNSVAYWCLFIQSNTLKSADQWRILYHGCIEERFMQKLISIDQKLVYCPMKSSKVSSSWSLTVWVLIFSATRSNIMLSILRFSFWTFFSPYSALQMKININRKLQIASITWIQSTTYHWSNLILKGTPFPKNRPIWLNRNFSTFHPKITKSA